MGRCHVGPYAESTKLQNYETWKVEPINLITNRADAGMYIGLVKPSEHDHIVSGQHAPSVRNWSKNLI
jgi:hypothetical protein